MPGRGIQSLLHAFWVRDWMYFTRSAAPLVSNCIYYAYSVALGGPIECILRVSRCLGCPVAHILRPGPPNCPIACSSRASRRLGCPIACFLHALQHLGCPIACIVNQCPVCPSIQISYSSFSCSGFHTPSYVTRLRRRPHLPTQEPKGPGPSPPTPVPQKAAFQVLREFTEV